MQSINQIVSAGIPSEDRAASLRDVALALKPYGYEWLVSATGICGPGGMVIVFAGTGDFYAAYLTHDRQVVWVMTCGDSDIDTSIDEVNALHGQTRDFYRVAKLTMTAPPPAQSGDLS